MTIDAQAFADVLEARGIHTVSGVPCSILDSLQQALERRGGLRYVPASVEGEALALAAGAWLAGEQGAVLIQSSGLGNVVNPLASLALPYRIPLLLVISWRGQPGTRDAVHHAPMGAATVPLLDALHVPHRVLDDGRHALSDLEWALEVAHAQRSPVALLVPRGTFGRTQRERPEAPALRLSPPTEPIRFGVPNGPLPSRRAMLDAWWARFDDARCVSTTGYMSRELARHERFDAHFPMQGSMGFAAAVGLGIHLATPHLPVCILDGDGALWMRLGSLPTLAAHAGKRLVHVVADNGGYVSTGGQPTVSVDFARMALAAGYVAALECMSKSGLDAAFAYARERMHEGPVLVRVRIEPDLEDATERPGLGPADIATRFRAAHERIEP